MRGELPLLPYLEVGERATIDAVRAGRVRLRSGAPEIVGIETGGVLVGRVPGAATVEFAATGDDAAYGAIEVRVLPAEPPRAHPRPEHPRIRYTGDELRRRREILARGALSGLGVDLGRQFAALLARADGYAGERELALTYTIAGETFAPVHPLPIAQPDPLPQPRGFTDYPFWTQLARTVEGRMTTLALAYSLSGEGRYAAKAREYLLALAGWRKWHEYDKATNNLSLPHFTIGAAIVYDELWHLLDEGERATAREALLTRGLRPMSHMFRRKLDHNIATLLNIGMVVGYLAAGDELPHAGKFFNIPLDDLEWYLARREEGTTTEGLLYTSYALNTLLTVASQVRRATGDDTLWRHPAFYATLPTLYLYFRGGAGGLANLSDAGHEDGSATLLAHLARERADPIAGWLIRRYHRENDALLLLLDGDVPAAGPDELGLPASRVFAPMGWAALRSGWGDDATLLAFVASGSAAGHNHYDQNHCILNVAGEWLLTDPGYQTYSPGPENVFTNATLGHNALLVNGEGQEAKGGGRIVDAFLPAGFDYVAGDATGAYGGKVARWVRRVFFVKPWYIVLADEVTPADPGDMVELLFHSGAPMLVGGRRLGVGETFDAGGDEILIAGARAGVGLRVAAPEGVRYTYETYPGAERFGAYLRVRLAPAARHRVVTVLQPRADREAGAGVTVAVRADGGGGRLTVERGDERDTLFLGADGDGVSRDGVLACRAEQALVTRDRAGAVRRVVLLGGTELRVAGRMLIAADRATHLALTFGEEEVAGTVRAGEACRLRLRVPWAPAVTVDGARAAPAEEGDEAEAGVVTLALPSGTHAIALMRARAGGGVGIGTAGGAR